MGNESRYVLPAPLPQRWITVPPDTRLYIAYGISEDPAKEGARKIELRIALRSYTSEIVLFRQRQTPAASGQWHQVIIPWTQYANLGGFLDLRATATDGTHTRPALVYWTNPVIKPLPLTERPNLILISIDTLRADRLGCYGYGRPTSPQIDRLAREGVRFARAISASSWTLPSHASLLTGLTPARHGATTFGFKSLVSPALNTLAELLWDQGYETAALTGGLFLMLGFDQGFDRFWIPPKDTEPKMLRETVEEAKRWISRRQNAPFFLFLHTYAVHAPYEPPTQYQALVDPGGGRVAEIAADDYTLWNRIGVPDAASLRRLSSLYDGEIRHADDVFAGVWDAVRTNGLAERTCVVVTSDHGDELNEHGHLFHSRTKLFDEIVHVPLIVWCPGRYEAGRVIDQPVSLVDVMPTLLDIAGAPLPKDIDGRSLEPLLLGQGLPERATISEVDGSISNQVGTVRAVRTARYKLVQSSIDGTQQLYDLETDPGETRDVGPEHADVIGALSRLVPPLSAPVPLPAAAPAVDLTDEVRERLRVLGYGP